MKSGRNKMASRSEWMHTSMLHPREPRPQRQVGRSALVRTLTLIAICAAVSIIAACGAPAASTSAEVGATASAGTFGQAQVFALFRVDLKPGVSETGFEQAAVKRARLRTDLLPGTRMRLFRADRAEQLGQYLLLLEFGSLATRDRYFSPEGRTAEGEQRLKLLDEQEGIELYSSVTYLGDYIVVDE
jgi:hypothetical protein